MKKLAGFVLCGGLVLVACGDSASNDAPPLVAGGGSQKAVLHEGAVYVSSDLSDVADVRDDRLVFPADRFDALAVYKPGQILLGDRGGVGNRQGFLRKVTSVTKGPDGTTVMTQPATLPEAVDELEIDTTLTTPELEMTGPVAKSAAGLKPQGGSTTKHLDFSGKKLFEVNDVAKTADNKDVPYTATASIETGTLAFSPKWDLKASVGFLKLRSFDAKASGQLDAKIVVDVAVKLAPTVDAKTRADLAGKLLTKTYSTKLAEYEIELGSVGIGPFKLPSTARFTTTLACDFGFTAPVAAKIGGSASGLVSVGLAYDGKKLTPSFDKSSAFDPTPPAFTQDGLLRGVCTVTPRFELKLFGVATAELSANAFAGIGAAQSCVAPASRTVAGDAEAGISAKVLAKVDVFGLYKWKKECTLFDVSGTSRWERTYADPNNGVACVAVPTQTLPPRAKANPESCFGDEPAAPSSSSPPAPIAGSCTHHVCVAGEKLGQACNACTQKICAVDSYCCDTYWGLSCLDHVQALCGEGCN